MAHKYLLHTCASEIHFYRFHVLQARGGLCQLYSATQTQTKALS